jgi:hypothetical protein
MIGGPSMTRSVLEGSKRRDSCAHRDASPSALANRTRPSPITASTGRRPATAPRGDQRRQRTACR